MPKRSSKMILSASRTLYIHTRSTLLLRRLTSLIMSSMRRNDCNYSNREVAEPAVPVVLFSRQLLVPHSQRDYALTSEVNSISGQQGLQISEGSRLMHNPQNETSCWMSEFR